MNERPSKALAAALELLSQYYDTVQIFATKQEQDGTTTADTDGVGNLFARIGQTQIWTTQIQEYLLSNPDETDNSEGNDNEDG